MVSWHHLVAWKNLHDRVRLVAICDPDISRAQARAEEFGVAKVYKDAASMFAAETVDAVDIASPRETHIDWIEAAAARNVGILCQKPLAPTLMEAEALIGRLPRGTRLMAHENWRFRPWYRELHRWMAAGEIGDVHYARLSTIDSGLLPDEHGVSAHLARQPFLAHESRLMIAEALIHHLDVMRFLCGPLRVVAARTARSCPAIKGETLAAIFLETAARAPVIVTGTMAAPGYPPNAPDALEIVGSKASAVLAGSELRQLGSKGRVERYDAAAGYQSSFDRAVDHFASCLIDETQFETSAADNLETLRLVEQAYRAAAPG